MEDMKDLQSMEVSQSSCPTTGSACTGTTSNVAPTSTGFSTEETTVMKKRLELSSQPFKESLVS